MLKVPCTPVCHVNPVVQLQSPVAKQLMNYWLRHTGAEGSVEAIVEWWMLEERVRETIGDVEVALEELVEKGLVRRRRQADGRVLYALRKDRDREP